MNRPFSPALKNNGRFKACLILLGPFCVLVVAAAVFVVDGDHDHDE